MINCDYPADWLCAHTRRRPTSTTPSGSRRFKVALLYELLIFQHVISSNTAIILFSQTPLRDYAQTLVVLSTEPAAHMATGSTAIRADRPARQPSLAGIIYRHALDL